MASAIDTEGVLQSQCSDNRWRTGKFSVLHRWFSNRGHEGLFAVVIWISSTQIPGTFQANCVLRDRSDRWSLRWRLGLASTLWGDFVNCGRVARSNL
jgi:hypothetical protein